MTIRGSGLPLEAPRKRRRTLVDSGRTRIGSRRVIPGRPADGITLQPLLLLLRVRITILAEVGLLAVGHHTTRGCRGKILDSALTRGAAAGSTVRVGARNHPGRADNGSPGPVDGTADTEEKRRDVRLEMRGVCLVRRSTQPHASDGDAKGWVSVLSTCQKDRGGISLSAPHRHCFSLRVFT